MAEQKKIMMARLAPTQEEPIAYQVGEINEAEYGEEWDGNVFGYVRNAIEDWDDAELVKYSESNITVYEPAFGDIIGDIYILMCGGTPCEIYWCEKVPEIEAQVEDLNDVELCQLAVVEAGRYSGRRRETSPSADGRKAAAAGEKREKRHIHGKR
ncbi:MAG: hypothetical protein Q4C48_03325 [Lachnospiraceae bacterium]|nr:hypothetical protein [Lachnospiraceae bacterium]